MLTEEGRYIAKVHAEASAACDMVEFVTIPEMETRGAASMFSEKEAVMVTNPVVIRLSESLVVIANVADEGHVPHLGN